MRQRTIILTAVFLVIVASLGYCHARTTQLNAAFNTVVEGKDTEPDVVAKMGRPHQVSEGCKYYGGQPPYGCARQYVFTPPWSIVGEAWTVSLNADGLVIDKGHLVSP